MLASPWYANWQMHGKSGLRNASMEKQPGHHWNAEATLLLFGRSLLHNSSESNPWNRQDAAASQPQATEGGTTRWHPHRNQSRSSPNLCQPDCTGIHIGPKHIPQDVQKEQFSISGRTTCAYRCASIQAVRSCICADVNVWSVQLVEICVHTNAQHENLCSAHASLLQQNSSSKFFKFYIANTYRTAKLPWLKPAELLYVYITHRRLAGAPFGHAMLVLRRKDKKKLQWSTWTHAAHKAQERKKVWKVSWLRGCWGGLSECIKPASKLHSHTLTTHVKSREGVEASCKTKWPNMTERSGGSALHALYAGTISCCIRKSFKITPASIVSGVHVLKGASWMNSVTQKSLRELFSKHMCFSFSSHVKQAERWKKIDPSQATSTNLQIRDFKATLYFTVNYWQPFLRGSPR